MTAPNREPAHLTTEELAERWQTTVANIHVMNSRGTAPPRFRRGNRVLYPLAGVIEAEKSRLVPA